MKTKLTLKAISNYKIGICSLGILLVPFLQSCNTELHLQASVEDGHQTYSGPSYFERSPNGNDLGFNVGCIMLGFPENPDDYRQHPGKNSYLGHPGNFYASTIHGPAGFDYSNWKDDTQNEPLPTTAASSDVLTHLGYMTGLEFIQKNSSDGGSKITLNYLEIPLYAIYQTRLSTGNIFGGLGPYLAYGIGGKTTTSYNGRTDKMNSFDSAMGFKPFDAGLGLTAGYKLPNSFYFSLAYNLGLTNIARNSFGDKAVNSGFSLNVGYPIDRIIKKK
ncbi:MAG TPA: porin family protein [Mucilaginibacter sp.]|nr:porin family protein [Mucilaginibacter sp.]